MNNDLFNLIKADLQKSLKQKRYDHTMGVMYTSASLAMRYGCDVDTVMLAGLLHDVSKAYSSDIYVSMADERCIPISSVERANPELIHAKLSAYIAQTKYGITDDNIINAITYHTTGRPEMTIYEKIVYIADYIEPSRTIMPRLDIIREMAFCDIDEALLMIIEDTLEYLKASKKTCDPMTEMTYLYYKK